MSMLVELPTESYPSRLIAKLADPGGYNFATTCAMMWLSQLAYETTYPKTIDEILDEWGLARIALLKGRLSSILPLVDTRGLIVQGWGGIIVAFAGTDPLVPANWLTNFDTLPSPDDIHIGFENAVNSVWPDIRLAILEPERAQQPLFFTGHSLGGALAVVAAKLVWSDRLANVSGVYTFGMPRCGGRRFGEEYDSELGPKTYRLVHGDDIVPTVPPTNFGFRHVGCLLTCRHGDEFNPVDRPTQAPTDDPPFAGQLLRGTRDAIRLAVDTDVPAATQPGALGEAFRFLPPGIGDHIPSRYCDGAGRLDSFRGE
jgi:triacylglycerol lipase